MKSCKQTILWLLLAGAVAPALTACEEGVFEDAGEEVDDAVDDASDEIDRRN
jgi:hypothetical protein